VANLAAYRVAFLVAAAFCLAVWRLRWRSGTVMLRPPSPPAGRAAGSPLLVPKEGHDMTTPRRRPAPTFHPVEVTEISQLTPGMRRITLAGDKLASYPNDGPGTHFKLLLPAPGQAEVVLPATGPDGGLVWPEPRPIRRTYTPRYVDREGRRLAVDFVLHGDGNGGAAGHGGPASAWAAAARVGDRTVVTGARGAYRIDPDAGWTLLVADETALPAVGTILDDAPAGARVMLVAEVAGEDEHLEFGTTADLTTVWCHRDSGHAGFGTLAAQAVRELALPVGSAGRGMCWVGLEASAMRVVRRHLLGDRGLEREQVYTRGYWKLGEADHPDHDTGED
jgi:NADPH-dependent ferric siderophore reductase